MMYLYDVCMFTEKESVWVLIFTHSYEHAIKKTSKLLESSFMRMEVRIKVHQCDNQYKYFIHIGDSLTDNQTYATYKNVFTPSSGIWTQNEDQYDIVPIPPDLSLCYWIVACFRKHSNETLFHGAGANYYLANGKLTEKEVFLSMIETDVHYQEVSDEKQKELKIEMKYVELTNINNGWYHILHRELC